MKNKVAEPIVIMDGAMKTVFTVVELIAGGIMFIALYINVKQYKLQRKEVMGQNQKIINLLEGILKK